MRVFYCDLDNTLIYSQRHEIGPQKVGVERYEGAEISFMTCRSLELLAQLRQKLLFVPTTTRSLPQYERVRLGAVPPEYALVCNGGVLLRQGVPDEAWYRSSLALVAPSLPALHRAQTLLEQDENRSFELRFLQELFLFTKSSNPPETVARLERELAGEPLSVFSQGAKIYVLPTTLTKGHAVARLNALLGEVTTFAAGDSPMDGEMLLAVDWAFAPQTLAATLAPSEKLSAVPEGAVFSEFFLQRILETL